MKALSGLIQQQRIGIWAWPIAFGCIGLGLLALSHADTTTVTIQATNGSVNGAASIVGDTSGSKGSTILFGSSPSHLVWSDEFNGASGAAPDNTKWNEETGGAGWGNNELECYTNSTSNAQTNGSGQLVITALSQPGHTCSDGRTNDYTSARLDTLNHESLTYGRMEARMKVPNDPGMWPAFWAVGTDEGTAPYWPFCGEIDTMEAVGNHPGVVYGTLHGPLYNAQGNYQGPYGLGGTYTSPAGKLSDGYHIYGVTWTPTKISFDFDHHIYSTITKAQVDAYANPSYTWEFNKPFFMRLNLAVGGNFPGSPTSATTFPQQMLVDYVRVYQ